MIVAIPVTYLVGPYMIKVIPSTRMNPLPYWFSSSWWLVSWRSKRGVWVGMRSGWFLAR